MRGWSGLSLGFPIRRNLPLLAFSLFALIACPDITRAQDVMVLPPSTDAASSTPAIFSTTTAAEPEAPPTNTPAPAPPVTAAPTSALGESPFPDQLTKQCATDADCVISDGGCNTIESVNKDKHAAWRARVAHSLPGCKGFSATTMHLVQQTTKPVCRENLCGLLVLKTDK